MSLSAAFIIGIWVGVVAGAVVLGWFMLGKIADARSRRDDGDP